MAEITPDKAVVIDGVRIRVEGGVQRVDAARGTARAAVSRGAGGDPFRDVIDRSALRLVTALDLELGGVPAPRRRGAADAAPPRLVFEAPPLAEGEQCHVMLVEEAGEYRWIFPEKGTNRFALPVEPDEPGARGFVGDALRSAVKFLAVKALKQVGGATVRSLTRLAEERIRPSRVRTFTAASYARPDAAEPSRAELAAGRALLVIHGTNSSTHNAFGALDRAWVDSLNARYGGRVFAFDHPTLATSPRENAAWLSDWLHDGLGAGGRYELDILCHSRGGLVARELAERPPDNIRDQLAVRSVVFVATPNNGTPLVDTEHLGELVDTLTNLAAVVPDNPVTDALEVVLGLVQDVALDVAMDNLPGLQSMRPGGAYLTALNAAGATRPIYRALAANFEPLSTDPLLRKLRNRLFDTVFAGAMNDLVVPTRSAYLRSGAFQVPADQRVVFDSSHGVDHSGFWGLPQATSRLADWLRPDWDSPPLRPVDPHDADPNADLESAIARADRSGLAEAVQAIANLPGTFKQVIDGLYGGPVSPPPAPGRASLGAVIVLPGILGSLLDVDGQRVWVSPRELCGAGFATLRLGVGQHAVSPAGLHNTYVPLVTRLAQQWDTYLFPYDWRCDLFETADRLEALIRDTIWGAGPRPVHLVAHSMGGLVARAFIASHPETWAAMDDPGATKAGGRLLMLGTPNLGSYAIPLAFLGEELLVKGLAALNGALDKAQIVEVLASFPAAYQMLPAPGLSTADDHAKLFEAATWGSAPVAADLLRRAAATYDRLDAAVDTGRFVYVAGDGYRTPARLRIAGGAFRFGVHDAGDGRVTHDAGRLPGVPMYFSTASHGGLVADEAVLDSVQELLQAGTPGRLSTQPAPRRGVAADRGGERNAADVDPDPRAGATRDGRGRPGRRQLQAQLAEATSHYLADPRGAQPSDQVTLRVRVTHASLEQADYPIAVGHYQGLPPEGAEGFLDRRLDGLLTQHRERGDYPEEEGRVLLVDAGTARPPGAIVLGLGAFGELTGSKLVRLMRRAGIRLAMAVADRVPVDATSPEPIGIATVLIGTPGRYGLSVEGAVDALIEGTARAALALADSPVGRRVRLEELQIVELHEERATHAAEVAAETRDRLPVGVRDIDLRVQDRIDVGRGGRPGMPSRNASGDPWVRIEIEHEARPLTPADPPAADDPTGLGKPCRSKLRFSSLGRGAQLDRLTVEFEDAKVRALIRGAISCPDATDVTVALYEHFFPHDAKLELDGTDNLHLLVDQNTAAVPWELLTSAFARDDHEALALRTGLLRQLRRTDSLAPRRSRPIAPTGRYALVIGDPPAGSYPRLPGARREATNVERLLTLGQFEVDSRIYAADDTDSDWEAIEVALFRRPYRVLHFATHGQVDDHDPCRTGLVIGADSYLTALDFEKMSITPDLVFVNACHVGRTGDSPGDAYRPADRANELAANVALKLMQNGVKAVIAAGWAVDDQAALAFATRFYERMLNGAPFGDAVREARLAAHDADGGRSNTWGAYQCYGDPGFQLNPGGSGGRGAPRRASAEAVVRELTILTQEAGEALKESRQREIVGQINDVAAASLLRFPAPRVYHALAEACAEVGAYQDAVWAYRQAAPAAQANKLPLIVLEQLANLEVRLACQRARKQPARWEPALAWATPAELRPARLFAAAKQRLDGLLRLHETAERHALVGSYWKKRATLPKAPANSLRSACEAYAEAARLSAQRGKLESYHVCLWAQTARLANVGAADLATAGAALAALEEQLGAAAAHKAPDFWTDAARGDLAVSQAVLGTTKAGFAPGALAKAAAPYLRAFENRSTVRERDSVLDHLRDLAILVPSGREEIEGLIRQLTQPYAE